MPEADVRTLFVVDELFPVRSAPGVRIENFMRALPRGSYIAVGGVTGAATPPPHYLTLPRPSEREPIAFATFLCRLGAAAVREVARRKPNTVVLSVPKYELLVFAPALARGSRRLIIDLRDSLDFLDYGAYLEHFLPRGVAHPIGATIQGGLAAVRDRAVDAADIVTVANPAIARTVSHARVTVLPNGVDTDLFRPAGDKPPYDGQRLLRLGYVGNFAEKDRFDLLLGLGSELNGSIEVHLVGDGRNKRAVLRQLQERGIRLVDHGRRAHEELPRLIGSMDLGFIFREAGVDASVPVCLFEFAATAVPACCNDVGLMAEVVRANELGFVVENMDDLRALLLRLIANPQELRGYNHVRSVAVERFSLERTAARFGEVAQGSGGALGVAEGEG